MNNGMHLILDLDHTIVEGAYINGEKTVLARPYLKQFILFVFNLFKTVSIWTAADRPSLV